MKQALPPAPSTLSEMIGAFAAYGSAPALVAYAADGHAAQWDYTALARAVGEAAAAWRALGAGPGERVMMLAPPGAEWAIAALGAIAAGATVVPIDVQTEPETLSHILSDSGVRAVYTTDAIAGQAAQRPLLEPLARLALPPAGGNAIEPLARTAADEVVLMYTSGTTGKPKGVPLTHANLAFQIAALGERGIVERGDRLLQPLPLHHVYPFTVGLIVPLGLGLTVVFPAGLGGPELRRALHDGGVTVLLGVPRLYRALADNVSSRLDAARRPVRALLRAALARAQAGGRRGAAARAMLAPLRRAIGPRLRLLACGGAPLDRDVHVRLSALGFQIGVGYGLTETSPLLTLDLGDCGAGSVGHPLPRTQVRVVPGTRPEQLPEGVDPGAVGEVEVRGPGVFGGYLAGGAAAPTFSEDGWFRTGDLGYQDDRGCLYLLGRAHTLVMTESGKKFDPEPVEGRYQTHAALAEVGLLADEGRVAAVIVAARESGRGEVREAAVRAALREAGAGLASYQRIERYVLSDEPLARTPLGKLRRGELAARYQALRSGAAGDGGAAAGVPEELIAQAPARAAWEVLRARFPEHALAAHTDLRLDLGVDSIGWVSLTLALEEQGVHLPEAALEDVHTVEEFLLAVQRCAGSAQCETSAATLDPFARGVVRPPRWWMLPWRALAYGLAAVVARTLLRLQVRRDAPLPPPPCLIAANHASYIDAPVLAVALGWRVLRHTCFAGWVGVMHGNLLMRTVSRLSRVLPIDPERRAAAGVMAARAAFDAGNYLVWFPEGQRSADGVLAPLRPGMAVLLTHRPVPVVPVWIEGTHAVLPPGTWRPRLRRVRVRIGAPLPPPASGEDVNAVSARVEAALRALAPRGIRPDG